MGRPCARQVPVLRNPEQNYLAIKAEVLGIDPYKITKDESMNVILSKKDSSTQMLHVPHMAGTKFGISGLVFYDTAKAYYQFNANHNCRTRRRSLSTMGC